MREIMLKIARLLGKNKVGEVEKKYYVQTNTLNSNIRLGNYLEKYELLSKKYEDYEKWREVLKMIKMKEHLTDKGKERVKEIKVQMSKDRK